MKAKRRIFANEFKESAVKFVREQGMSRSKVAADLGAGANLIGRWVRDYENKGQEAFPGNGRRSPQEQKIRDLEQQLRQVTMEREEFYEGFGYCA